MTTDQEIQNYINSLPESKKYEMQELHKMILEIIPSEKLWFLDGKNEEGKIVSNPNIGYGIHIIKYANGSFKEFYQIGLSANTTGISVYIMGIEDKKSLAQKFGDRIGKATVSGYCIKFKTLKDINVEVLLEAVQYGITHS